MPKLNDLTNRRFGKLIVLCREKNNNHKQTMWKCKCDCGTEFIVRGYSLTTSNTTSCGCRRTEMLNKRNKELGIKHRINETGNKYGKLSVIELDEEKTNNSQNAWWICQCDCGNLTSIKGVDLRRNHTMSCGCIKSQGELQIIQLLQNNNIDFVYQYSFKDLIGITSLLKFDFAIFTANQLSYLIEYDGIQHFETSSYFGGDSSFKIRQNLDSLENEYCVYHKIPLIRIKYTKLNNMDILDVSLKEGSKLIDYRE